MPATRTGAPASLAAVRRDGDDFVTSGGGDDGGYAARGHPQGAKGSKIPRGESCQWGDHHLRELAPMIGREAAGQKPYRFFTGLI